MGSLYLIGVAIYAAALPESLLPFGACTGCMSEWASVGRRPLARKRLVIARPLLGLQLLSSYENYAPEGNAEFPRVESGGARDSQDPIPYRAIAPVALVPTSLPCSRTPRHFRHPRKLTPVVAHIHRGRRTGALSGCG